MTTLLQKKIEIPVLMLVIAALVFALMGAVIVLDSGDDALQGTMGEDSGQQFQVIINANGIYSIWFVDFAIPQGWEAVDFIGTQEECSNYIDAQLANLPAR